MTFLLSRLPVGITDGGIFTIAEVNETYHDIVDSPKLPVVWQQEQWSMWMQGVTVNGKSLTGNSMVSNQFTPPSGEENSTLALLDSGTTLAQGPSLYVDAMYKNVPSAQFDQDAGRYVIPCNTKLNISMTFGNNTFPMNPLDSVQVQLNNDGTPICYATFSYTPDNFGIDWILGDAFLRNVYSLFNFGNYTASGSGAPFIQLLSVTNADEAWADYDSMNSNRISWIEQYAGTFSGSSSYPRVSMPTIIVISVIFGSILLIILVIVTKKCLEKRKNRAYKAVHASLPPGVIFEGPHNPADEEGKARTTGSYSYSTPYDDGGH
ncbi:acid protease [Obba rivulosa]|uniref:Acid protease n=1 Tax=Obba rivulosa TaxID=1052685 RepID=A0A8E2DR98_9APHY|nr:acid protease [Obba rivulosa]